jgi:hypothetical protein
LREGEREIKIKIIYKITAILTLLLPAITHAVDVVGHKKCVV